MTGRGIVVEYLSAIQDSHGEHTKALTEARRLFEEAFKPLGEFWVDRQGIQLADIVKKPFQQLTQYDVLAALTDIVAKDQIYESIRVCETRGVTAKLLERLLQFLP